MGYRFKLGKVETDGKHCAVTGSTRKDSNMFKGNHGGSKIAVLFYLLVSIIVIYAAIKTVPPYMDYYSMDDEVAQQLRTSTINSDDFIIEDLMKKAEELDLPLGKDDIIMSRDETNALSIDIKWAVVVDYGYGFKKEFPFELKSSTRSIKE